MLRQIPGRAVTGSDTAKSYPASACRGAGSPERPRSWPSTCSSSRLVRSTWVGGGRLAGSGVGRRDAKAERCRVGTVGPSFGCIAAKLPRGWRRSALRLTSPQRSGEKSPIQCGPASGEFALAQRAWTPSNPSRRSSVQIDLAPFERLLPTCRLSRSRSSCVMARPQPPRPSTPGLVGTLRPRGNRLRRAREYEERANSLR
jgi:hypothetical protein